MENKVEDVERVGLLAAGKNELIKHLEGNRLTQKQAINAKCYDCMGYFIDGRADCLMPDCPLYPFMRYNPRKAKNVVRQNPKHAV